MADHSSVVFPGTTIGVKMVSVRTGEQVSFFEENGRYEDELNQAGYSLRKVDGIISHSRISHDNERGVIEPGNYVGLLKLQLLDKTGAKIAETYVDVRSTKLGYEVRQFASADSSRRILRPVSGGAAGFRG